MKNSIIGNLKSFFQNKTPSCANQQIRCIRFLLPKGNEGIAVLAEKVLQTMEFLKTSNSEMYAQWYCCGYSRKQALKKTVSFDVDCIEIAIQNNWDKKFPVLGSHFGWWNGKEDDFSCGISFTLGMTSKNENIHNVWSLTMPYDEAYYNEHVSYDLIRKIKEFGDKVWNPIEIKEFNRE